MGYRSARRSASNLSRSGGWAVRPLQIRGAGATFGHWDPLRSTVLLAYCESYADWHRMTAQVRGKEVVLQGATRTVDDQGHVTTAGGKASANPLLPVIDRAHRSLQVALEELLRPAPWAVDPATAPAADGTRPEPDHPWLRHPDETAKAYAAFRYYRDLGAPRSAGKVREKFGLGMRLIERWSSAHAWVRRALAWDEHQDRIAVALSTDAIQTMRPEQADCGRAIQVAALETLDARMASWRDRGRIGEPPFTAFEAARLIRIGSYLEQTARGLKPEGPGELPGEALQEWAAKIEAILTEPRAHEPIP